MSQLPRHHYCDPSYIADSGLTSCPAVTQTVGMLPGSIASYLQVYATLAGPCYSSSWDTRQVLSHAFCKIALLGLKKSSVMRFNVINFFPWCFCPVSERFLYTSISPSANGYLIVDNIWLWESEACVVITAVCLLCASLAAGGDLEGLEMWKLAGADLNKPGYDGQTALQLVGPQNI